MQPRTARLIILVIMSATLRPNAALRSLRRLSAPAKAAPPPPADLPDVKRKVVVLSGKGGVGKSTLAAQLAWSFALRGQRVGLLDLDICGPSIPHLLGLRGQRVGQSAEGKMAPVKAEGADLSLDVMSIGFLLPSEAEPVVLRGPRKDGVVRNFFTNVSWGAQDILLIDTPPGTSDEHLSMVSALSKTLSPANGDGAIVVSTPAAVSLVDVRKELSFCAKQGLPVLGVVENMAPLRLPLGQMRFFSREADGADVTEATLAALRARCPELLESVAAGIDVFPQAEGGAEAMAKEFGVPFLGRVPLDRAITAACEAGTGAASAALDGVVEALLEPRATLRVPPLPSAPPHAVHAAAAAAAATATKAAATPPRRGVHTGRGAGPRRAMSTAAAPAPPDDLAAHEGHGSFGGGPGGPGGGAAIAPATVRSRTLFPTTVHVDTFAPGLPLRGFNEALVARALAAYERCWRSRQEETLAPTGLPGGWRTTANMLFFRQQLSHWRGTGMAEHVGPLQRSEEFAQLLRCMRGAARRYLEANGAPPRRAAELAERAPLFCWASVHLGGSCHPPHVHSDAAVTGTYYARRPTDAAPLCLEDPRGRSPFDLVAGLESRLRYGTAADGAHGATSGAVPPFDRVVQMEPRAGECVLFPPWLVHSVPVGRAGAAAEHSTPPMGAPGAAGETAEGDELLRVSFSFNLLGRWEHTVPLRQEP